MEIKDVVTLIISTIMMLVGVITFVLTQTRNSKKDAEDSAKQLSDIREEVMKVRVTLEGVNRNIDETKSEIKGLSVNLHDIDTRLTRVEEKIVTAFKRIDELREGKADKE